MSRFLENLVRRGLGETPPGELPLSEPDSLANEPLFSDEAGNTVVKPGDGAAEPEQSAFASMINQQRAAAPGEPMPQTDRLPLAQHAGRPAPGGPQPLPTPPALPLAAMQPANKHEARPEQASPSDRLSPPKRSGRPARGLVEQEIFMVPPARVEWPEASRPWAPPPRQPAKALEPLEGHIRGRLEAPVQTEIQPTPAVRPPAQTLAVVPANDAPTAQPPAPPRAPTPPTPALRQVEPVETRRAEESVVERIVERIHEREIIRAAAETGSAENAISTVLEPSARATAPQHPASEARPVSPRLPPLRPAAVPATLPILKPAPTPELKHAARVPPAARKPQESPPHIEVRIGSVEVRATPQSAPAESRIAEAPMRVEEFDNYRGLRNYFQWFRG